MPEEPMSQADAKRLAQEILATGTTTFSRHAREEMAKDNLQATDVLNVLRAGVNEPTEFENGSWLIASEPPGWPSSLCSAPTPNCGW